LTNQLAYQLSVSC